MNEIVQLSKDTGLTYLEIAKLLGVNQSTVYRWKLIDGSIFNEMDPNPALNILIELSHRNHGGIFSLIKRLIPIHGGTKCLWLALSSYYMHKSVIELEEIGIKL